MCLLIELEAAGVSRSEAGAVSRGFSQTASFAFHSQRRPRDAKGSSFLLGCGTEQCACRLLAEGSGTSAREFILNAALVPALESALRYFLEQCGSGGFNIRAWWDGRPTDVVPPHEKRAETFETLLRYLRTGRIGNNISYQVNGKPPNPRLQPTGRRTAGG